MDKPLLDCLMTFLSPEKKEKISQVIAFRTRHVTFVLEDFFQEHNISAVIRSSEIFGIQDLHIIEKKNQYTISTGIDRGASQWLDIHRHRSSVDAITRLKQEGYRIVATVASDDAHTLESLAIDQKLAFLMGTEYAGLSQEALALADECVTLPMFGFTQSFNVSVCAALCMHNVISRLHRSSINWALSAAEKEIVLERWIFRSVKHAKYHKQHFYAEKK